MFNPTTRLALLAPVLALSLFVGACGGDDSDSAATVSSTEIEEKAKTSLGKQVGQTPASVDCPSDLDAEQGAKETCTLTDDQGNTYDMTATVSSVSDGNVELEFKVSGRTN